MNNTISNTTYDTDRITFQVDGEDYYCTKQEISLGIIVAILSIIILLIIYTILLNKHFRKKYENQNNQSKEKEKDNKSLSTFKICNIKFLPYILSASVLLIFILVGLVNTTNIPPIEFILLTIITACAYTIFPLYIKFNLKKNFNILINILLSILNTFIVHAIFYYFFGATIVSWWSIVGIIILFYKVK